MESIDCKKQSIRISRTVHPREREQIEAGAKELGIYIVNRSILNPALIKKEAYVAKLEDILQQKGFPNKLAVIFPPVIEYSGSDRKVD